MEPTGSGSGYVDEQASQASEGASGFCTSCGRDLPPPDLEAVAESIDQTLSLEAGRVVPRTAWAGRPPDGVTDALMPWLPAVKARRRLWERGQQLWTEQMTAALSGPCADCLALGSEMAPGEMAGRPDDEPLAHLRSTIVMPPQQSLERPAGMAPQPADAESPDDGRTTALPAYAERAAGAQTPVDDAPTSALPTFAGNFSDRSAPQPPDMSGDEHESHTVMLSSLPSLRTSTRLVVLEGPVHGRQFSLGRQLTTIGRSIGCHVTIDADPVSYDHARIVHTGDTWKIELVGGATELSVNDEPVTESRTLQPGDVVRIGPARLRFETVS